MDNKVKINNDERTKDNWLALFLAITYIEEKQGYYSSDEALRKLKIKEA